MANQASRHKKTLQKENEQLREKLTEQRQSTQVHEHQEHHLEKELSRFRAKLEDLLNEFARKKKRDPWTYTMAIRMSVSYCAKKTGSWYKQPPSPSSMH